jgi:hypothetical protein
MRPSLASFALGAICFVALAGCGGNQTFSPASQVASQPITLTIVDPSPDQVEFPGSCQFSAAVTGTDSTAVTWQVITPNEGTISDSGVFTPGDNAAGTVTIKATLVADPSISATTTVSVLLG